MLKGSADRFKGKKVAVLGLGLEGKDLVRFLVKSGAKITVFDQKEKSELDLSGLKVEGVNFVCGESYLDEGFSGYEIIYLQTCPLQLKSPLHKLKASKFIHFCSQLIFFYTRISALITIIVFCKPLIKNISQIDLVLRLSP